MMRTLRLKNAPKATVHLQELIVLRLSNEEGTAAMIQNYLSFHQSWIWMKMLKPLLFILMMADSNHRHMDKLWFMVLIIYDHVKMSMPDLNNEDYLTPVTDLE